MPSVNHKNNQDTRNPEGQAYGAGKIPILRSSCTATAEDGQTITNNQSPNIKVAKPERFGYYILVIVSCLVFVSCILYLTLISFLSPVYAEEKQPLDITSDEVEYVKVKGKEVVIFTGHVVAIQKTTTLKSDQLKLFPDEKKVVAEGGAWMRDEKEKMILTGEKIEYYHDKRYGMATGKPRLVSEKEDFTLTSKKMETFLPEDRLRATGKVKLVRDDMVATCKILDYFDKEKKAILTDNPQIKEKENLVTGDKITLFVDEHRVVVEEKARIKFIPKEKE